MKTTGKDLALDKMGFTDLGQVLRNLPVEDIIENEELDITLEEINYLKEEYELEDEEADSTEVV